MTSVFAHYFDVALRNIRRAPFASAVSVVTLAVGLVCFVTAYAFVTFWAAADQHFRNADAIHVLTLTVRQHDANAGTGLQNATRVPDIAAEFLKADFPAIHKIARAAVIDRATMVASDGRAERLFGVAVDPTFLEIFDLPFVVGDAQLALAAPRSAVLTREAAARLFGADDAIGKTLVIGNSIDATVTGVVDAIPEPSHMGRSASAALPFDLLTSRDVLDALRANPGAPAGREMPGWFNLGSIVYLHLPAAGGLSADALVAQLDDFVARHVPADMLRTMDYRFSLAPVGTLLRGTDDFFDTGVSFSSALLLLGGLVLGVACVNYANLATARAVRRVREVGVRKTLGASPRQVALQSLFEAGALAAAALVAAVAAFALVQPFVKALLGAELAAHFFSSLRVWPALGLLVLGVTLAAGVYPAFALSRLQPSTALAAAQARLGSPLFAKLLVGTQFGIASFLLIAVTVISLQNADMRRSALNALEDPLVIVENPARQTHVAAQTLRERLSAVPQVRAVTEFMSTPWESLLITTIATSEDPTGPQRTAVTRQVGFDFFEVFAVPVIAGRGFDREHAEDLPRAPTPGTQPPAEPPPPTSVVVDRSFVRNLDLGTPEQAVEQLVHRPTPPLPGWRRQPPLRIIGVVEDRSFSFFKLPSSTVGAMYLLQTELGFTVARVAAGDLDGALAGIDAEWRRLAPNVAIRRRFLDEIFERAYSQYVRMNQLFGALAVMAFAICVAGLFGMATFVAGRRRREIGIRKTLGGHTAQMIALLLGSFSKPVLVANLIAWPAGYLAARAYLNQFSESIELTVWPFVASLAITVAVAWLAVLGQTLRAARTTPAEVLRHE
jgi:putative ABC transport system permease protein